MLSVQAGGKRTPLELFNDHPLLIKAMDKSRKLHIGSKKRSKAEVEEEKQIKWLREFLPPPLLTPSSIDRALRTFSGTQKVSNFSPVQAASIYHQYLPEQGGNCVRPKLRLGRQIARCYLLQASPPVHRLRSRYRDIQGS
jgi:hypothetical protein